MKREKMARIIGLVDEKFVEEATPRRKRRGRKPLALALVAVVLTLAILGGALAVFAMRDDGSVNIEHYKDSEYYPLIEALSCIEKEELYTKDPEFIYESLGKPNYVEVTDNQVSGVIEGDLFKRSETHIFYLFDGLLSIYEIDGEKTEAVSSLRVDYSGSGRRGYDEEIYLSEDGTTVTAILNIYDKSAKAMGDPYEYYTKIFSVNVNNPLKPVITNELVVYGTYATSRLVDGQLYVSSQCKSYDSWQTDPSNSAPLLSVNGEKRRVRMDDICLPNENPQNDSFALILKLDESDLSIEDEIALLSYSANIHFSNDKIFANMFYYEDEETQLSLGDFERKRISKTEITVISYGEEDFAKLGTASVDGTVSTWYGMNEYKGVLRVATTTCDTYDEIKRNLLGDTLVLKLVSRERNASLFCIDLDSYEIIGSVERFAPKDESVFAVRFSGEEGYICTAQRDIGDPVYYFDLSDPQNITQINTGTIPGYSTSLVDMGEGLLLGIGFADNTSNLKLELYSDGGDRVNSVTSYIVRDGIFTTEYKAYYIDREQKLVGFAHTERETGKCFYTLCQFNGKEFAELCKLEIEDSNPYYCRGTIIDGVLYVLLEDKLYTQMIFGE